ncbi:MAG: hypothetical protein OMM_01809 [Candidatus Magnetoglobus multicellularis str. Araruama]|uniref:Uncharacterized protein n=1 Tax=Candidatus Magnetoglobus multicellularis str. Araruama TaxID=890399 RepID=A0A1V1PC33_9BACT|nr:MAG: hypothetical protein OMM_01809 [Candidatus Magnetoglobus multicellularis str. Araruama]
MSTYLIKKAKIIWVLKKLTNHKHLRDLLQIKRDTDRPAIKKKLSPHVTNAIRITNGYKGLYVTRNMSDTELIISSLGKKTPLGTLKMFFPIQTTKLVQMVSQMIMSGKLHVSFSDSGSVTYLKVNDAPTEINEPQSKTTSQETEANDDRQKMKKAYDAIGGGQSYVRIYKIREYLDWPKERFNKTLEQLTKELAIQLHAGDPSVLTEEQLKNSYVDDEQQICITISWRKK